MRHGDLWAVLFFLGLVAFNWPFLTVVEETLPYSLFVLWGLFIAASWLLAAFGDRDRNR